MENRQFFTKQKNLFLSFKKKQKKILRKLQNLSIKLFLKTRKSFLLDRVDVKGKVHLSKKSAEFLNNFTSSTVQNLVSSRYSNVESIVRNRRHPTMKAILKCRNH